VQPRGLQRRFAVGGRARQGGALLGGQSQHRRIGNTGHVALVDVEKALQSFEQEIEHRDDEHVEERHRRHGLDHQEVLRIQTLADHQDLGQRDHRHQRGELDDGDVFVGQRRQRHPQRLGNHHAPLRAEELQAQCPRRFALALGNREQATAMDLGHVGGLADHQREQAGPERVGQDRRGAGQRLRQVVDKDQQHQQRQAAEQPDVTARRHAEQAMLGLLGQRQQKAQADAQDPGQGAELDHRPRRTPELGIAQQTKHVIPVECHRRCALRS